MADTQPPATPAVPEAPPKELTPLEKLGAYIAEKKGAKIKSYEIVLNELMITIDKADILPVIKFLRDDKKTQFQILADITAVDFPESAERFDVVYNLLSLTTNRRIRIKVAADEETAIDSIVILYPCANWFEREVFDMYGVFFDGHPDLRRILTDYGFEGYPLRKDFPLTGYVELRYDQQQKRCVYEPVKLPQDFRTFDFLSPWEGMTDVQLPGDEKAVKPKFMPDEAK